MRWASALSLKNSLEDALRDCAAQIRDRLDAPADLAALFLTPHFSRDYEDAPKWVERLLHPRHFFGCSSGGVIAAGRETERRRAVGMIAGVFPNSQLTPFHLESASLPDMDARPQAWAQATGLPDRRAKPHFVILADPFSFNPEDLARGLDYAFAGSVTVGGMASGASRPGQNILYLNRACHRSGAVGVAFTGNVAIDPIVAQGCRPIGSTYKITLCEENLLMELDGRPALKQLDDLLQGLPAQDRRLARHSLCLGVINNPFKQGKSGRDYLVRNLVGLDPERGLLAVGAMLRPGQTVRFHLRDKRTSSEDLARMLQGYLESKPPAPPRRRHAVLLPGPGRRPLRRSRP